MHSSIKFLFLCAFIFSLSSPAAVAAADDAPADHADHLGKLIHEAIVEGHRLAFHLLKLPGRQERHLMTYISDEQGRPITGGKVGYLIVGPDGGKQKVMATAMTDAFGGDVDFTAVGAYTIAVKAVYGDHTLLYRFQHVME